MRLRTLFESLLALPPVQRDAWMNQYDLADAQRQQLRRMLALHGERGLLDRDAAEHAQALRDAAELAPGESWVGRKLGPYRLVELIGHGGMATVFRAERTFEDVTQIVAIKLLHLGLFSELSRAYFGRERRALAQLEHPNIARLIDGGTTDSDVPFLVMEYVHGVALTEHCAKHASDSRERLRLLRDTCRAVEAAHRALIVHRDLKPANVLVLETGEVKLLDFGIAKLLDEEGASQTQTGLRAMTPAYAAPEQLAGEAVTTASDVYALGILLHELLLGALPERPLLRAPSETLAAAGAAGLRRTQLRRLLRGDIDTILQKALDEEPARRYSSAGALADDIQRYLDGQPVSAYPPSRWYRVRKFIERHRLSSVVVISMAAALLLSSVYALLQAQAALQSAAEAEAALLQRDRQLGRASAMRDFMLDVFSEAEPSSPKDAIPTVVDVVNSAIANLPNNRSIPAEDKLRLQIDLAQVITNKGDPLEAVQMLARIAADAERELGRDHPVVLDARIALAYAKLASDDGAAAADELAAVLKQPLARESRANALSLLGYAKASLGDFETAVRLGAEALQVCEQGCEAKLRAEILGYLASAQHLNGGHADSIVNWQRAIALERQTFGGQHLRVASGLSGLSRPLRASGQLDAAMEAISEALSISRQVLPADDLRLANHFGALALVQRERRDMTAAMRSARESLRVLRARLGDDVADTINARNTVGFFATYLGEYALAEVELTAALASAERLSKGPSAQVALCRQNLANAIALGGRRSEGVAALNRAVSEYMALRPRNPSFESIAREKLARLYVLVRRPAESLQQWDEIEALTRETQALADSWAPRTLLGRAQALLLQGQLDASRRNLDALVSNRAQASRADPDMDIEIFVLRAELALASGDRVAAEIAADEARARVAELPAIPRVLADQVLELTRRVER